MDHNFKKYYGQNFLTQINWIIKFLEIVELDSEDTIVEIGPGMGAITEYALEKVNNYFAIEIDEELIEYLQDSFGYLDKFNLINVDFLRYNLNEIVKDKEFKLIGALPYNISKKIIKQVLESKVKPNEMTFIVQKEVGIKYTEPAPRASFLYNYANIISDVSYHGSIPRNSFHPQPKVDGGIIKFKNLKKITPEMKNLIKFIKLGFSQPRKKLSKNLSNYGFDKDDVENILESIKHNKSSRAAELKISDWRVLFDKLNKK